MSLVRPVTYVASGYIFLSCMLVGYRSLYFTRHNGHYYRHGHLLDTLIQPVPVSDFDTTAGTEFPAQRVEWLDGPEAPFSDSNLTSMPPELKEVFDAQGDTLSRSDKR